MKIKKLFFPLLVSTMLLSSCSLQKPMISLFIYSNEDTFITNLSNEIIKDIQNQYSVSLYDGNYNQTFQNQQITNAIENNKINTLIINMVDRLSSGTIVQKALKKNIPVIFFNREPVASDIKNYDNVYYVGTNPNQEGINQAIMASELWNQFDTLDKNKDGMMQCIFIRGEQSHQDTEIRTSSCINHLNNLHIDLDILSMEYGDWTQEKGYEIMQNNYEKFGNSIEFIFANNDDMAIGAINYLLDKKALKDPSTVYHQPFPIVGVDGTKEGLEMVKKGYMQGTTINDTKMQADAIHSLINLINHKITLDQFPYEFTNDKYVYVTGKLITKLTNIK